MTGDARSPRPVQTLVIGSGPGGAITACLCAEAGRDTLLIEEGPFFQPEACEPFTLEEMRLKYRSQGLTAALGSPPIQYAEGRCVGGGSEINSALYHRTPGSALERWREEFAVQALREEDLLPHFEAIERDLSVGLNPAGPSGASAAMLRGAERMGWRASEAPRWFAYSSAGANGSSGKAAGVRQTMSRSYIPRAIAAGCRVMPDTRALRLRREAGLWRVEVETISPEPSAPSAPRRSVLFARDVFVCGGAIQTPALLRRSGLTRSVGDSLRLHPMIKLTALFPDKVNSAGMGVPAAQIKEFAPNVSFGCSISSPAFLALALNDHAGEAWRVIENWERMAVYYAATTCHGSGIVRNIPGFRDPLVRYRLLPKDLDDLAAALRDLARSLFAAGALELRPSVSGAPTLRSEADLEKLPASLPRDATRLMTVHLFSSCPMGDRPDVCPTDSFGRVRGADNLRVSDASLLCGPPGVNPQGSIMAIARRNAMEYLGQL